jgi:hypothetical protein
MAPVPTPEILWRKPPVLALAAVPGTALGRLQEPSTASSAAWAAAGAAVRTLHEAPLPPWRGPGRRRARSSPTTSFRLTSSRATAASLRSWTPAFVHGGLQLNHVLVDTYPEIAVLRSRA